MAEATIISPDGTVAHRPTEELAVDDVKMLRAYKNFLRRYGLREKMYCQSCGALNLDDGMRFYVDDGRVWIECGCKVRFFVGATL